MRGRRFSGLRRPVYPGDSNIVHFFRITAMLACILPFRLEAGTPPAAGQMQPEAEAATPDLQAAPQEDSRKEDAVRFTFALMDGARKALTAHSGEEQAGTQEFRHVLAEAMDLDAIGRFMLGSRIGQMSDAQRERYDTVFPAYITLQYAGQFAPLAEKPLKIVDSRNTGRGDVIVRSEIILENKAPVTVDWRIRRTGSGQDRVIDIIVSGVSIMLVKRQEFSSVINASGIDTLLDLLARESRTDF